MSASNLFSTLHDLEIRYWDEVDRKYGREAHLYFAEQSLFVVGDQRFENRDGVREFYAWREDRGDRTARHIVTNAYLSSADPAAPAIRYVMFLFADDGVPVLPSHAAILVGDTETIFEAAGGERWLIRSRIITPIFMGGVAPTLPGTKQR